MGERDREMRSDAGSWGDAIVFKRGPLPSGGKTFFESRSIHRLSNGRIVPERRLRFMLRGAISHPRSLLGLQMEGRINRGENVGKYFQLFMLSHESNQSVIYRFVHTHRYIISPYISSRTHVNMNNYSITISCTHVYMTDIRIWSILSCVQVRAYTIIRYTCKQ